MLLAAGLTACSKPEEKKADATLAAPAVIAPAEAKPTEAAPAAKA